MSFRDNLQHLRATRNMTQEQLAMLVGVSRQSVTKWEAERAYPEMDKLLKICQIFDCSLDELVQGDLTAREPDEALAMPENATAADVTGYDEHCRDYARRMALGVASCILGIAVSTGIEGIAGDVPMTAAVFVGVGIGLFLIIPACMERSAFSKAHPYIVDFYDDEQRLAERKDYGRRLAAGICLILLGMAVEAWIDGAGHEALANGLLLMMVAAGVGLIVYSSLLNSRLDVEKYNISSLEELDEEEIASIVGEERAARMLAKVRRNRRISTRCGIIMLAATAIALLLLILGISGSSAFWAVFFWLPWVGGGLLCAVVAIAESMRERG